MSERSQMTAKRQDQELVRMAEEAGFKRGHILANEIHADGVEITGALNKFAALIRAQVAKEAYERESDVCSALVDGLNSDDEGAKQWALESALKLIAPDEFADTKASWGWADGRKPE